MNVDDVLRDASTLGASSGDAADWPLGRRAVARYVRRHAHSTLELNNTYRGEAAESVVAEATEIVLDDTDTWAEIDGSRGPIRVQIKCSGRYQRWRDDTTRVSWTVYGKRPNRDGRPVKVLPTALLR